MPDMALLQSGLDVSVPTTTTGQKGAALAVVIVLIGVLTLIRWRSRIWGYDDDQKALRERVRDARYRQTPATLELPSAAIRDGSADVRSQVDSLFDVTDPEETHTKVRGALARVYRAVSVAWSGRVESVPLLARRTIVAGVLVALTGAVAVSTGAIVELLAANPDGVTPQELLTLAQQGISTALDIVWLFPYTGVFWALSLTFFITASQWLYQHWYVVAAGLFLSAASIVITERRLDESNRVDVFGAWRWQVVGLAITAVCVWFVGAFFAAVGRLVGFPGIGDIVGFAAAVGVVLALLYFSAPRLWRGFRQRLELVSDQPRWAVASLGVQKVAAALALIASVLVVLYAIVAVADGRLARIAVAFAEASPEIQAGVGAAIVGFLGLFAYAVADAWTDVRRALGAAFAQKAVRAQLAKKAMPGMVVVAAYVLLNAISGRIVAPLILAFVVAAAARKGVEILTAASYKADWRSIWRRVARPEPMIVGWLAYELTIESQRGGTETYYLLSVNGAELAASNRADAVNAAVRVGEALANNEKPPSTDEEWQAQYLLQSGIASEDWEHKHTEKIRKRVFDHLRKNGPRVTRNSLDKKIEEFSENRQKTALTHETISPYVDAGPQYVTLVSDPYRESDDRDWPEFSPVRN